MMENPLDGDMWLQAIDAKYFDKGTFGKEEWDQLLGHCMVSIILAEVNVQQADAA